MPLPGFTAEAGVYKTNNHYRLVAGGSFLSDGNTTVVPQGCGWGEGILCGALIVTGAAACTAFCFSGPAPCAACWLAYLGGLYQFCKDCIPAWMQDLINELGSGGGTGGSGGTGGNGGGTGGGGCCPAGKRCCGSCVKVSGRLSCDDFCVGPHQSCP
jgi:hypothetical protein